MSEKLKRPNTILGRLLHSENLFNRLSYDHDLMSRKDGLNPHQREAAFAVVSLKAELEHPQDKNSQNH